MRSMIRTCSLALSIAACGAPLPTIASSQPRPAERPVAFDRIELTIGSIEGTETLLVDSAGAVALSVETNSYRPDRSELGEFAYTLGPTERNALGALLARTNLESVSDHRPLVIDDHVTLVRVERAAGRLERYFGTHAPVPREAARLIDELGRIATLARDHPRVAVRVRAGAARVDAGVLSVPVTFECISSEPARFGNPARPLPDTVYPASFLVYDSAAPRTYVDVVGRARVTRDGARGAEPETITLARGERATFTVTVQLRAPLPASIAGRLTLSGGALSAQPGLPLEVIRLAISPVAVR
jgi:hypothetical protein